MRTSIRRLSPTDAVAYRAIMLEAYAAHPDAFTSSAAERSTLPLDWWRTRLGASPATPARVLGAFDDDDLVGVAGLMFHAREKIRHKVTLFGMYVATGCRARGVGRGLVDAALQFARRHGGVRVVQLTVTQGNLPAQALYARCGFEPFGVEPLAVAVDDAYVAKVHMWCDLASADSKDKR